MFVAAGRKDRDAYRAAVEMALADGVVTRAEERALARLAQACGLDHLEALDVREEVERERAAAASEAALPA